MIKQIFKNARSGALLAKIAVGFLLGGAA